MNDQAYIVKFVAPLEVVSDSLVPLSEKPFGLNPHMPRDMLVPHQWMSKQTFYIRAVGLGVVWFPGIWHHSGYLFGSE